MEAKPVDPPTVAESKPLPLPPCDTIEVPAQVMLAMDTSGSMSLPAGNRPDILEIERQAIAGNADKGRQLEALAKQPGRKRMDDARAAATELIGSLSRKAAVGIASFDGRCDAKIDVVPTLDRSQTKRVIEAFKPQGATPIAATLRRVRDAFGTEGDPDTPRSVILITDGEETCKGDPCGEARQLAQAYKNLKIHVIDVTGTSQLQCLADATKGTIVKAGDLEELKAAVARAATGVHQQMNCAPPGGVPSGAPGTSPGVPQRRGEALSPTTPAQPVAAQQPEGKLSLNEQLERSTVLVIAAQAGSLGSGFFVAPDLVVTSRHVVQGAGDVPRDVLVTSRALGQPLRGEVVGLSDGNAIGGRDYAIVRLRNAPAHPPVILPIATAVEKRVSVIAAGYPGYLVQNDPAMKRLAAGDLSSAPELVLSEGKVQVMHKSPAGIPLVVHSADISQGNSGGPLVDSCGRVVAINTFIGLDPQSGRRGLYSLGGDDLVDFLKSKGVAVRAVGSACDPD
jgi:S1-C subfamily serine protease